MVPAVIVFDVFEVRPWYVHYISTYIGKYSNLLRFRRSDKITDILYMYMCTYI